MHCKRSFKCTLFSRFNKFVTSLLVVRLFVLSSIRDVPDTRKFGLFLSFEGTNRCTLNDHKRSIVGFVILNVVCCVICHESRSVN